MLFGALIVAVLNSVLAFLGVGAYVTKIVVGASVLWCFALNYLVAAFMGVSYRRRRDKARDSAPA